MAKINQFDVAPTSVEYIKINLKELKKVVDFVYDSTTEYYKKLKTTNPEVLYVNINQNTISPIIASTKMKLTITQGIEADVAVVVNGLSANRSIRLREVMPYASFSYSVNVNQKTKEFTPLNMQLRFDVDYFHWNQVIKFKSKYMRLLESTVVHELTHSKDIGVYIALIEDWAEYETDDHAPYQRMKYINNPGEVTARVKEMTYHINEHWDSLIERCKLNKITSDPLMNIYLNSVSYWPSSLMEDYSLFSKSNQTYTTTELCAFIKKRLAGGAWGV